MLRADCYGGSHDIFEREILSRILEVSRSSSHEGCKYLLHLLGQFNHRGPNGDHVCLVFNVLGHHLDFQAAKYEDGRLPVKAVKEIVRQLLTGLDFLHRECGIIHTDLKPTNILLELETPNDTISEYLESVPPRLIGRQNGAIAPLREVITTPLVTDMASLHVRIIDFGVASWRENHLSDLIQSLALRAPEVTIGAPWDTGVDIWSLGCLVRILNGPIMVVEFVQGIVLFSGKASENGTWSAEDDHLARIAEVLGPFPSTLLEKGRRSAEFFDKQGIISTSIVLPLGYFANVCESLGKLIRVRNLKSTSLECLVNGDAKPFIKPADMPETEIGIFIDFIKSMLAIDPMARKSAAELLQHEWLS
ncbi:kinase-like domain [Cordyceps militaris]|uniref:non-specific serine/threonine protein kinase n=1 Tax=Cordyceps militaris TaxID=73501 RepID=A0A2H4SS25_CORMI|nr:kinase-like domain [Cordyceps militaris]